MTTDKSLVVCARPILFSGAMVRAIIEGRKTQTRRVMKPQFPKDTVYPFADQGKSCIDHPTRGFGAMPARTSCGADFDNFVKCPCGRVGDTLWVRETWAPHGERGAIYQATNIAYAVARWHPSIHMPRWASRLTLEITDIRVQRLQEISSEDAVAEGFYQAVRESADGIGQDVIGWYRGVWNSINAKRAPWSNNPWVWVLTFRRIP